MRGDVWFAWNSSKLEFRLAEHSGCSAFRESLGPEPGSVENTCCWVEARRPFLGGLYQHCVTGRVSRVVVPGLGMDALCGVSDPSLVLCCAGELYSVTALSH